MGRGELAVSSTSSPAKPGEGLRRTSRERCEDCDELSRMAVWQARHGKALHCTGSDQIRSNQIGSSKAAGWK